MRWISLAVLVLALSTADAAPVPKHLMPKAEPPTAERLAGTWTPKDRPELGTIEYTKAGKMTLRYGDGDGVVYSTFRVEAGQLFETTNMVDGPETVVRVITRLTDTEFAYKLSDGREWVLVRVNDK